MVRRNVFFKKLRSRLSSFDFWMFVGIGLVAGWFAFPFTHVVGLLAGLVCGVYVGFVSPLAGNRLDKPLRR